MRKVLVIIFVLISSLSYGQIRYNQLPDLDSLAGGDYVPVFRPPFSQGKATFNTLIDYLTDSISGGDAVDSIWRVVGTDSIYWRKNGTTRAILDSTGGASPTSVIDKQDTTTSIAFTAGTAPSGTTNHRYSYSVSSDGRTVHLHYVMNFQNAGATVSAVVIPLPPDVPLPVIPNGLNAANANLYTGFAILSTSATAETTARGIIKRNAANNGYEMEITAGSGSYRIANVFFNYFAELP